MTQDLLRIRADPPAALLSPAFLRAGGLYFSPLSGGRSRRRGGSIRF